MTSEDNENGRLLLKNGIGLELTFNLGNISEERKRDYTEPTEVHLTRKERSVICRLVREELISQADHMNPYFVEYVEDKEQQFAILINILKKVGKHAKIVKTTI